MYKGLGPDHVDSGVEDADSGNGQKKNVGHDEPGIQNRVSTDFDPCQ